MSARIAVHQRDVLGDRHVVDETEILMDEADRPLADIAAERLSRQGHRA